MSSSLTFVALEDNVIEALYSRTLIFVSLSSTDGLYKSKSSLIERDLTEYSPGPSNSIEALVP